MDYIVYKLILYLCAFYTFINSYYTLRANALFWSKFKPLYVFVIDTAWAGFMAGISFSNTQLFDTFFSKSDWRFSIFSCGFRNKADAPPIQFPKQTRSNSFSFSFKHQRYCFSRCSEIIWTRNFKVFIVCATIYEQFPTSFHFSNYIREIHHFTLDLLKRCDT